jgi:hypothetical protein
VEAVSWLKGVGGCCGVGSLGVLRLRPFGAALRMTDLWRGVCWLDCVDGLKANSRFPVRGMTNKKGEGRRRFPSGMTKKRGEGKQQNADSLRE